MHYIQKIIITTFILCCSLSITKAYATSTLYSTLEHVYSQHPLLLSERYTKNKISEQIKEAKTGWQPNISANGNAASTLTEPGSFGTNSGETAAIGISITQPIYKGGRTVAETKEAELLLAAQNAHLYGIEQTILLDAAIAYIAIFRDQQLVLVREKNVSSLQEQLNSEQTRYELGENTITDISQAKARLAESQSNFIKSKGQLANTVAEYERVIGIPPRNIKEFTLPTINMLDKISGLSSLNTALLKGADIHPDIIKAELQEKINKKTRRIIKAELYPTLSVVGETKRNFSPTFASNTAFQDQSRISLQATIPLYNSGSTRSKLKQAKHDGSMLHMELLNIRRDVQKNIITAWQDLLVMQSEKKTREAQLDATKVAFDGTKEEFYLGGRTTLDVLDAEKEKLEADIALITAKHDVILAKFKLLNATGQLNLENLKKIM